MVISVAKPTLPVVLWVGDTAAEIGTVDLPLVAGPVTQASSGRMFANFAVDHAEFRRGLADLLRSTAHELEKGASADGE